MNLISVIIPPIPSSIPQPTILEEPPIPVGLKIELEIKQEQSKTIKSEKIDNSKNPLALNSNDDPSASLSQQEDLSVKGLQL